MTSDSSLLNKLRRELSGLPAKRVLAVSGGLDSMLLLSLHLLHAGPVYVLHVNYGRRGRDSDADESLVARICRINGLPFYCFNYDDAAAGAGTNFQQQARRFRYLRLETVRKAVGADIILTAHHADDQRESLLFQTLRSGAISDISGITARKGQLVRPFLNYPKSQLRQLADATGLPWREDSSNAASDYTRNALRNKLIPLLDAHLPQWGDSLDELSATGTAFHQAMGAILGDITSFGPDNTSELMREAWLAYPEPLRTALLHAWLRHQPGVSGNVLSRPALQQLSRSLPGLQSGRYAETRNLQIWRERSFFKLMPARPGSPSPRKKDEETALPLEIRRERLPLHPTILPAAYGARIRIDMRESSWGGQPKTATKAERVLELSLDRLHFPLILRWWQPGDRIQPLGMTGHQKVSDVLTNKKTDSLRRKQVLLLCGNDGEALALIWPDHEKPGGIIAAEAACITNAAPTLLLQLRNAP
jgi:tRNA(Ile)-lysidine synthase